MGERQDAGETMQQLEAAIAEARVFFGIDPLFDTPVRADKADGGAQIFVNPGYFHRPISVDLDYYQRNPLLIREDMAHEVAHLVTDELTSMFQRLPPECSKEGEPLALLLVDAVEKATVRLEKLFMRERPRGEPEPEMAPEAAVAVSHPAKIRSDSACGSCKYWLACVKVPGAEQLGRCGILSMGTRGLIHHPPTKGRDNALHTPVGFGCAYHSPVGDS